MPEAQEQFQTGVAKVLEAVMFENWLRFYFITEKPDAPKGKDGQPALYIAVPVKGLERISEMFPRLLPMAEELNGQEVSFEASRRAVCNFVLAHVDGQVIARDSAAMIFESATFQVQMQLFNAWVQMHEEQLLEQRAGRSRGAELVPEQRAAVEAGPLHEVFLLVVVRNEGDALARRNGLGRAAGLAARDRRVRRGINVLGVHAVLLFRSLF